jgi:NADH-quinone oxidoreductase subunit M
VGLPLVTLLAAIGILYGAFCAYPQQDVKKLVAYSSVSHLGLAMLGMFALNDAGLSGSLMQMVNHGLTTGALFLLIGMMYERYHTRKISDYSGLASRFPLFAVFLIFTCLASAGLPGLNGFIGEVLVLMGIIQLEGPARPVLAIIGASAIILGAWYLLTMIRHMLFGPFREPPHEGHEPVTDLTGREICIIVPITALCVLIGVYPQPMLTTMKPDVQVISDIAQRARDRQGQSTGTAQTPSPAEVQAP